MAPPATSVTGNITLHLTPYTTDRVLELRSRPKFTLHTVKAGESLKSIADKHGIPYQLLLETNLSYNLATLTKRNHDLIERIQFFVDHNGEGIHRVPLSLEPGQAILIPETWRNKNRRHDAEAVFALGVTPDKLDAYSSDKRNPDLFGDLLAGLRDENRQIDVMARSEAGHVRLEDGLIRARNYIEESERRARAFLMCDFDDDPPPYLCHAAHVRISTEEATSRQCIDSTVVSYDSDADGWFSPDEYSALIAGCVRYTH